MSHFKVDLNTLIVIICMLISFLIIGFISLCLCECSENHFPVVLPDDNNRSSRRRRSSRASTRGLSTRIRESFPIFVYSQVKKLKLGNEALECAICLNEFYENDELRLLPECSHVFHRDCIDSWLNSRITCPVCRACLIPKVGEHEDLKSSPINGNRVDYLESSNLIAVHSNVDQPEEMNELSGRWRRNDDRLKPFRSKSMGQIQIQIGEESEKYTLRLSKEVLDQLLKSDLSRNGSCISFPMERSLVKGYRSRSFRTGKGKCYSPFEYERFRDMKAKSERWIFSVTPPCFPGGDASRRGSESEMTVVGRRKSFRFIRSPYDRLFGMNIEGERERIGGESPV